MKKKIHRYVNILQVKKNENSYANMKTPVIAATHTHIHYDSWLYLWSISLHRGRNAKTGLRAANVSPSENINNNYDDDYDDNKNENTYEASYYKYIGDTYKAIDVDYTCQNVCAQQQPLYLCVVVIALLVWSKCKVTFGIDHSGNLSQSQLYRPTNSHLFV